MKCDPRPGFSQERKKIHKNMLMDQMTKQIIDYIKNIVSMQNKLKLITALGEYKRIPLFLGNICYLLCNLFSNSSENIVYVLVCM